MAEKLVLVIDVDTGQVEQGLKKVDRQVDTFARRAGKALRTVAVGGAAMAASFGVASVQQAAKAEMAIAKLSTIAGEDTRKLKQELMGLPGELGSIEQQAEAAYQALSAGRKPAEAVRFVAQAARAAKGGFTDTATAVDAATTILNAYGEKAGKAEEVFDKFLQTQNLGKTTFAELATGIGDVAATAEAAGISVDEMFGILATTTAGGIQTSKSITSLRAAISNLEKPGKAAAGAFMEMGDEFTSMQESVNKKGETVFEKVFDPAKLRQFIGENGIVGLLRKIKTESPDAQQALTDIFGSVEAKTAMQALIKDLDKVDQNIKGIGQSQGAAAQASEKMVNTMTGQLEGLRNEMNKVMIGVGEELMPTIKELTQGIADNLDGIKSAANLTASALKTVLGFLTKAGEVVGSSNLAVQGLALARGGTDALGKVRQAQRAEGNDASIISSFADKTLFTMTGGLFGRSAGGFIPGFSGGTGAAGGTVGFTPSAADTNLIRVEGGEGIVSRPGMGKLGALVNRLNSTAPLPGGLGVGGSEGDARGHLEMLQAKVAQAVMEGTKQGSQAGIEAGVGEKGKPESVAGKLFSGSKESLVDAIMTGAKDGSVKESVKGFAKGLGAQVFEQVKSALMSALGKKLMGGLFGGGFGGFFASGGLPPVGLPFMAGENGPELVTARQPVRVHSNEDTRGMMAGGRPMILILDGAGRMSDQSPRGYLEQAAETLRQGGGPASEFLAVLRTALETA